MPIQTAWLGAVLPTLTINYLAQGALLLSNPQAIENPSFCFIPLGPAADDRGWIPLLIGALVMFVIFTWRKRMPNPGAEGDLAAADLRSG